MARIVGVDLPREKRVEIGLTYIYGIGRKTSNDILRNAGINPDTRVKDLTEEEFLKFLVRNKIKLIDVFTIILTDTLKNSKKKFEFLKFG